VITWYLVTDLRGNAFLFIADAATKASEDAKFGPKP